MKKVILTAKEDDELGGLGLVIEGSKFCQGFFYCSRRFDTSARSYS